MRSLSDSVKKKRDDWNSAVKSRAGLMQPFVCMIKFNLGRHGNSPLFFDAFVRHYAFLHVFGTEFFNFSIDFDEPIILDVPIKIEKHKDYKFYLCGQIKGMPQKVTYTCKRTSHPVLPIIQQRKIRVNAGQFKNYKRPMMYSNKRTYTIYGVGDIELINKIVPTACSVGKKAAIGFGEATICIKKADNFSLYKDGEYIRPIPVDYLQDKELNITDKVISSPIYPPYYGKDCKYYKCCM